jgi:hypothetical protein
VPKENINKKAENKTLIDKASIISYWIKMSDADFGTMNDLF